MFFYIELRQYYCFKEALRLSLHLWIHYENPQLLLMLMRVVGVKHSFARVCHCVSLHMIEPKTAETTVTKLATGIVRRELWILGQKVRGQSHRVTQCKNIYFAGSNGQHEFAPLWSGCRLVFDYINQLLIRSIDFDQSRQLVFTLKSNASREL